MKIALRCYAKINLGLRVLGLRADRYHELRTIFQTVSLYDTLRASLETGSSQIDFACNIPEIAGPENLVVRAAKAMQEALKIRGRIRLSLEKRIPMGAGLGGGSSDCAATIRAVAALASSGRPVRVSGVAGRGSRALVRGKNSVPPEKLLEIAGSLGADVPFFLLGGTALGLGRGTEVYSLQDVKRTWMVLAHPPVHVNTAAAYRQMDASAGLTESSETHNIYRFCASRWIWDREGDWPELTKLDLVNDFEPVVFANYPTIAPLKSFLARAGASPALLSGSGSAVFGLCESRLAAVRIGKKLEARFPGVKVWIVRTVGRTESLGER